MESLHYGRKVRALFDEEFPQRWIGRRGSIEWPARSPDLAPLDFFLSGYLKSKVYVTRPENVNDLPTRIIEETANIGPEMIQRATTCFSDRLAFCQEVNGSQFEYLM